MSLADLVSVIVATRMERRKMTRTEIMRRYRHKNAEKWNAYRRKWYAQRKLRELTQEELDRVGGY